jgi:hypothetical protein
VSFVGVYDRTEGEREGGEGANPSGPMYAAGMGTPEADVAGISAEVLRFAVAAAVRFIGSFTFGP